MTENQPISEVSKLVADQTSQKVHQQEEPPMSVIPEPAQEAPQEAIQNVPEKKVQPLQTQDDEMPQQAEVSEMPANNQLSGVKRQREDTDTKLEEVKAAQPAPPQPNPVLQTKKELVQRMQRMNSYNSQTTDVNHNLSEPRMEYRASTSSMSKVVPIKVLENMKKICNIIPAKIRELRDMVDKNNGTLLPLALDHLNITEDRPDMSVEDVIKIIQQINDRPAKIALNAYDNVYKRKHEWYGADKKDIFYASIPEAVYAEN